MHPACSTFRSRLRHRRGSVLVIVMITLIFTTFALVAFIERAGSDLLVDSRAAEAARLRRDAYSALETTLAVLENFRQVGGGLHSPAEGWSDPLGFAAWTPSGDRTVEITFEDESGKISLPRVESQTLMELFRAWEMPDVDAERLTDALMGWMKRDHTYSTALTPDYDRMQIPYEAPARPLRSFDELAAIEVARELLYGPNGKPNELWYRFANSVSLFSFGQPNMNGARPDVLAAHGRFDRQQQEQLNDYLSGAGMYQSQGPNWFTDVRAAQAILGGAGNLSGFGTTISALRVLVTVRDGLSIFRLTAVVTPVQNGATTVQTTASANRNASANAPQPGASGQNRPSGNPVASANSKAAVNAKKLNYPFTLLEIRENDEILALPPAPPPVPL